MPYQKILANTLGTPYMIQPLLETVGLRRGALFMDFG